MGCQTGSARRRPSKRVSNNSNKPLGGPELLDSGERLSLLRLESGELSEFDGELADGLVRRGFRSDAEAAQGSFEDGEGVGRLSRRSGDVVTTGLKLPKSAEVKFPSQGAANSFRGACPPERKQSKIPSDFLPKEARVG